MKFPLRFVFRVAAVVLLSGVTLAQVITTVAGGSVGDDGPAFSANLASPSRIAFDSTGNLYIADQLNHRIRKVAVGTGAITTVAGNGTRGFSGDGGPATVAQLSAPYGVAVDMAGNIYVADTSNYRIRKISALTGVITTVAGTGSSGFSGDGAAASSARFNTLYGLSVDAAGNIYVPDAHNNRVRKITVATGIIQTVAGNGSGGFGGDGGPAVNASLNFPRHVAFDSTGNFYIADWSNARVRKVNISTGVISSVAGGGTSSSDGIPATQAVLNGLRGVAVDTTGNIYTAERDGAKVRRVNVATGLISTVAGTGTQGYGGDGGPAAAAMINNPYDVAFDSVGNIYIAELDGNRIRKIDRNTGAISTVVSGGIGDGGLAVAATLTNPVGLAVDNQGSIFIADQTQIRIRKVDAGTGVISTVAGNGITGMGGDGVPATSVGISGGQLTGTAVDPAGNFYIVSWSNVWKVAGGVIRPFTGNSSASSSTLDGIPARSATLTAIEAVSFDKGGNAYVTDRFKIRKIDVASGLISTIAGGSIGDGGPATGAYLTQYPKFAIGPAGILYVAADFRLRKVAQDGTISTIAGNGVADYSGDGGASAGARLGASGGVAVDGSGNIFIGDYGRIRKIWASTGVINTIAGTGVNGYTGDGGPAIIAQISGTDGAFGGLDADSQGNLYFFGDGRLRKINAATGVISTVAGNGAAGFGGDGGSAMSATFSGIPFSPRVAIDSEGNTYVSDPQNNRVRKISAATGVISTIAGNGSGGFSGDGGQATSASLNLPRGLAIDSSGNLYIADQRNARIRIVSPSGVISTAAGNGVMEHSGDGGQARSAALFGPTEVSFDAAGNLLIGELGRIRSIDRGTGVISTVAGVGRYAFGGDGGPATAAMLEQPFDVTVDSAGNVYFADWLTDRVRKIEATTGIISTIAGNGLRGFSGDGGMGNQARLSVPTGVAVDSQGNVFIADSWNNRIRRVDATSGRISTFAGQGPSGSTVGSFGGDGGPATSARLNLPYRVAIGPTGDLFVSDMGNRRIRKIQASSSPDAPASASNYTALWLNLAEAGWGLNVVHQGDTLFATLFTYDSSGQDLWLVMSGGTKQANGSYSGTLYRTTGPAFNAVPFTPITFPANYATVGTMTLTFTSASTATLTYSVNGVTVTKSIQKYVYGTQGYNCVGTTGSRDALTNYQDLWLNEAEAGWGVNVTHQDNTLFATLFTYDASGRDMWLVMSGGTRQPDGSYVGDLYRTTGPAFNASPFTPITFPANYTTVGTMRFTFTNGTTGVMTYTVNGAPVTKAIRRFVFSSPVPACS